MRDSRCARARTDSTRVSFMAGGMRARAWVGALACACVCVRVRASMVENMLFPLMRFYSVVSQCVHRFLFLAIYFRIFSPNRPEIVRPFPICRLPYTVRPSISPLSFSNISI